MDPSKAAGAPHIGTELDSTLEGWGKCGAFELFQKMSERPHVSGLRLIHQLTSRLTPLVVSTPLHWVRTDYTLVTPFSEHITEGWATTRYCCNGTKWNILGFAPLVDSMRTMTLFCGICIAGLLSPCFSQVPEVVKNALQAQQYSLRADGREFLLAEGAKAHFFLLGELHGENEVPTLIRSLWPGLWNSGYRHVGAELSPWTAHHLEFGGSPRFNLMSLWTRPEAAFVTGLKRENVEHSVLWGCDIEEIRPDLLIADLAAANPTNSALLTAVSVTRAGYQRSLSPELLRLMSAAVGIKDVSVGGRSLRKSTLESLKIDVLRLNNERLAASEQRESLMKENFYGRWEAARRPKVLLRFGRNHLHRGLDRRGVSTLGNFVAEVATAHRLKLFSLAVFAGGGKVRLAEGIVEWDEREDDPAFAYLASIALSSATIFDLRPIRQALHRIPAGKRSPTELSLMYWADSYDAILYYKDVTPIDN